MTPLAGTGTRFVLYLRRRGLGFSHQDGAGNSSGQAEGQYPTQRKQPPKTGFARIGYPFSFGHNEVWHGYGALEFSLNVFLVGVLDGVTNLREKFQPLFGRQ
jgi:hypothetical protein